MARLAAGRQLSDLSIAHGKPTGAPGPGVAWSGSSGARNAGVSFASGLDAEIAPLDTRRQTPLAPDPRASPGIGFRVTFPGSRRATGARYAGIWSAG